MTRSRCWPLAACKEQQPATSDAYPLPVIGGTQTANAARVDRHGSLQCVKQAASDDAFPVPAIGGAQEAHAREVIAAARCSARQAASSDAHPLPAIGDMQGSGTQTVTSDGDRGRQLKRRARRLLAIGSGQQPVRRARREQRASALPAIDSGTSVGVNTQHSATVLGDGGAHPLPAVGGAASAAAGLPGQTAWNNPMYNT